MDSLKPAEIVSNMVNAGIAKAGLGPFDLLVRGALSGALLCCATSLAIGATTQTGQPIVGALIFPVGFVMIVLLGLELVTGSFALVPLALLRGRATLGTVLKELEPALEVVMFETLHDCAQESSQAWNNAGTGHAANCELNYTPRRSDGSIDISRALQVNTEFDISRQLWSHLVTKGGHSRSARLH